jgi:WD40 repeat protein/tRNA A-37 threonylcarbamoyl transferase component Bud32
MIPDAPPPDPTNDDRSDPLADEAAALDDYLGGFAAEGDASPCSSADPKEVAATLDLILRLRQTAAAEGGDVRLPTPDIPTSIGRYELVAVAGQGGFAVVWEAVDPLLRRRVAVKVRRADALLSPTLRRRFLREAEIASRLVHPHIVTIHEVGEEGEREYIVAEFCGGGSLAAWLARHPGPLPPHTAARLVLMLAEATASAHGQGVIHRDIKPANVLLTDAAQADDIILPDRQTVKLADFGLGTLQDEASDLTQLTASGSRLGTPAWMAPEQIDRSFGAVGPATDVHALGLMLQRMLTGTSPHDGRTDVEIYRSVLLDEPVPPDRLVRGVPRDLAAVCAACLAKRPAERYATAAAVAADLERFLAGRPTVARPLSPAARFGRALARKRMVAGLACGLLAAMAGLVWNARAKMAEERVAQAQREEIRRQSSAIELQRGFDAWRSGDVGRALERAAEARELSPQLSDSLAGRWLTRRLHGERRVLFAPPAAGSAAAAHAVAISPAGRLVAAGFADGTLRLIDERGRGVATVERAHDEINDVCFSADGQLLATAGQDGRCRWWRITDTMQAVSVGTAAIGSPLYGVTFLADGRQLVTGGENRILRVFEVTGGEPKRSIELPTGGEAAAEIEAVSLVTGDTVAVACGDRVFCVDATGDVPPRELEHRRLTDQPPVFHSLAVSADGTRIATGSSDRQVRIWMVDNGRIVRLLPEHPEWIQGCGFSSDGRLLVTACQDGMIRIFRLDGETPGRSLQGHEGRVWDVAFDPDGRVISAGADGTIREWDTVRGPEFNGIEEARLDGGETNHVRILSRGGGRGRRLIVAGRRQSPFMLRQDDDAEQRSWQRTAAELTVAQDAPLNGLAANPEETRLAVAFWRRPFVVGTIGPGGLRGFVDLPTASPSVGAVAWMPDGRLVTAANEDAVMLWSKDVLTATRIAAIDWGVSAAAAAPAGPPRVAVVGIKAVIFPVAAAGGPGRPSDDPREQARGTVTIPITESLNCVAWSPDGRRLLCGGRRGEAVVYDAATGNRLGKLVPHARPVVAVAWSPDGEVLLTADDLGMRLSDATTLAVFDEVRPGWAIAGIAVSAAGDLVALVGNDQAEPAQRSGRLATLSLPAP